jgi:hypothetical protein
MLGLRIGKVPLVSLVSLSYLCVSDAAADRPGRGQTLLWEVSPKLVCVECWGLCKDRFGPFRPQQGWPCSSDAPAECPRSQGWCHTLLQL